MFVTIKTNYDFHTIEQQLVLRDEFLAQVHQYQLSILETQNEQIRQALIAMGWMPPVKENNA